MRFVAWLHTDHPHTQLHQLHFKYPEHWFVACHEDEVSVPDCLSLCQLQAVEKLVPKYQSRPSILLGVLGVAGATLGALSAVAPRRISMAVTGAVQDALTEHFEDQLRSLRECGVAASVSTAAINDACEGRYSLADSACDSSTIAC